MTQKLFFVEVTKSGWILADSEADAGTFSESILETECLSEIQVREYDESTLKLSGWKGGECIYHKGHRHKDITLFEAMENHK
jgi:hypothetical protein